MTSKMEALQDLRRNLIRKTLNGSVFVDDDGSAAPIDETQLFDASTGDLKATGLPTGYNDLGLLSTAGAQFARSVSTSEVQSWQSKTPSRTDVTADTTTMQVAAQETRLSSIGLYIGVTADEMQPHNNGVVRINQSDDAPELYHRALSVAADEQAIGEFVVCRFLPRAKVTNFDSQSYAKGDDPVLWPVTLTGFKDDDLGFSHSWIFGGSGWRAALQDMGFTPAAAAVPKITAASRANLAAAGGQLVEINGSGFDSTVPTNGVKFAGTNAPSWQVVDDGTIVAVTPAHAAGTGPIVVTNATGASTTGPTVTFA